MLGSWGIAWLAVAAPAGLAAAADPAPAVDVEARAIVLRAIEVAGGREALQHTATLRWTGDAVVHAAGASLDIRVRTVAHPFDAAHSESWLRSEGPAHLRVLHIDAGGGWIERDGRRMPMPPAVLLHERQQYALYGLMRLLPLLDGGVILRRLPAGADGLVGLHVEHPAAPPADLLFDVSGRLRAIDDRVADPDGGPPIAQHIELGGRAPGAAFRWPRTVRILQNGAPYFELSIRHLSAGD